MKILLTNRKIQLWDNTKLNNYISSTTSFAADNNETNKLLKFCTFHYLPSFSSIEIWVMFFSYLRMARLILFSYLLQSAFFSNNEHEILSIFTLWFWPDLHPYVIYFSNYNIAWCWSYLELRWKGLNKSKTINSSSFISILRFRFLLYEQKKLNRDDYTAPKNKPRSSWTQLNLFQDRIIYFLLKLLLISIV